MNPAHDLLPPGVTVFERGWLSSNNILVRGPEGVALVDSGYCTHSAQTVELVRRAAGPGGLRTLVNTHLHSDHCGGNAALQERFPGLVTLIPPGLAEAVRAWDPVALTYSPTGQQCPRFRVDATLSVGKFVDLGGIAWQVHAAPGHDPHSVVLFEPESRTLLSADALWENGFGVVFPELEGEKAFDEVAETLDVIERLRPRVVVPGHGGVFTDVEAALAKARSRLAAYRADPRRHAAHAAKVLLKFKLLELQSAPVEDFIAWAETTPYFGMVRARFFEERPLRSCVQGFVDELVAGGAARLEDGLLSNV